MISSGVGTGSEWGVGRPGQNGRRWQPDGIVGPAEEAPR